MSAPSCSGRSARTFANTRSAWVPAATITACVVQSSATDVNAMCARGAACCGPIGPSDSSHCKRLAWRSQNVDVSQIASKRRCSCGEGEACLAATRANTRNHSPPSCGVLGGGASNSSQSSGWIVSSASSASNKNSACARPTRTVDSRTRSASGPMTSTSCRCSSNRAAVSRVQELACSNRSTNSRLLRFANAGDFAGGVQCSATNR